MRSHSVDLDRERRRYASAPKAPGKREVRKFLEGLSKAELVEQAVQLFADFAEVREYFAMRLGPADDSQTVRRKYKQIIDEQFFPSRGEPRMGVAAARQALRDYRKVAQSMEGVVDLRLHYAETLIAFSHEYGYMDAALLRSVVGVFQDAVKAIVKAGLENEFRARCTTVVASSHNVGWGLQDLLGDVCGAFLSDETP